MQREVTFTIKKLLDLRVKLIDTKGIEQADFDAAISTVMAMSAIRGGANLADFIEVCEAVFNNTQDIFKQIKQQQQKDKNETVH